MSLILPIPYATLVERTTKIATYLCWLLYMAGIGIEYEKM